MKSILVKIFLILNLILCAAVLVFGISVFRDREIVKARAVLLKNNADRVAENLHWAEEVDWEASEDRQEGEFRLVLPESMDEMPPFEQRLEALATLADTRVEQLSTRYEELVQTTQTLRETEGTLDARVEELTSTREEVASVEEELTETESSLNSAEESSASLRRETDALERQASALRTDIAEQDEKITELETELAKVTGERDRIEKLLRACRRNIDDPIEESDWHQRPARILAVVPEWDYVVINKGEVDVLPMYLEAYVHRGDEFIGKVRVMRVERTVALAEILEDTLVDGKKIKAGDTIFF